MESESLYKHGDAIGEKALVVFSGGQDSTTCLHWALHHFKQVYAVFFDYGQRHVIEWESAHKIAALQKVPLKKLHISAFKEIGGNALTNKDIHIQASSETLPNTFVPGRNLIFLSYAASYAYTLGISQLVTGVCQTDFSGYPDCREETIRALEKTLCLGMEKELTIHTPLMYITKAESVHMAQKYSAMESLKYSHTCYQGTFPPCGTCPSCVLRQKGFEEAGVHDPLLERDSL
jgi:7-cyano-7-deazaguanine synthase